MKEMKTYRKASLSFGHLPEGERAAAGLPVRQGSRNPVSDFLFSDLNADRSSDAVRFSPDATTSDLSVPIAIGIRPDNVEIRTIEHQITNAESGSFENLQPATCNQKTEQPSHTMTSSHSMTAKYKVSPQLPRGGFYSGDCPGAAAITIILSLFSSPRVTPIFAGTTQKNLPVANLQALHRSSFVPLVQGDEIRFSESGGKNHKTLQQGTFVPLENPEGILRRSPSDLRKGDEISRWLSGLVAGSEGVQEVSTTTPKIRMKGFLKERRYAVT